MHDPFVPLITQYCVVKVKRLRITKLSCHILCPIFIFILAAKSLWVSFEHFLNNMNRIVFLIINLQGAITLNIPWEYNFFGTLYQVLKHVYPSITRNSIFIIIVDCNLQSTEVKGPTKFNSNVFLHSSVSRTAYICHQFSGVRTSLSFVDPTSPFNTMLLFINHQYINRHTLRQLLFKWWGNILWSAPKDTD